MLDVSVLLAADRYIILDGSMGMMLQRRGLEPGKRPETMNITDPDTVEMIHRLYIEAGSDIIYTNTFGANALMMKKTGYSPEQTIEAALQAAKRAVSTSRFTAGISRHALDASPPLAALDIGPTGELLEPSGELSFNDAYEMFKEMAVCGERAGADLVIIETMSDPEELKAAMKAVKENTELPVFATMTFDKSGHTFMGCTPQKFVETAEANGAAALGLNCSLEPSLMFDIARQIAGMTELPLIIKPNAGLPDPLSGCYSIDAEEFAAQMLPYKEIGVKLIGGCCGTTPEYIKALKHAFGNRE